jgi:hypothetical protein
MTGKVSGFVRNDSHRERFFGGPQAKMMIPKFIRFSLNNSPFSSIMEILNRQTSQMIGENSIEFLLLHAATRISKQNSDGFKL